MARGCSEEDSKAYAIFNKLSLSLEIISVTSGSPLVIVPVLSKTTKSTLPVSSKAEAFLNKIPFLAPLPDPTIMATGVASPSAQGQAITKIDIALDKE